MNAKDLAETLKLHKKWLGGEKEGIRADLSGADLCGANLSGADLREADLRGADLRVADLSGADLSGADLREANLSGADLREADIDYAVWPLWCKALNAQIDDRIIAMGQAFTNACFTKQEQTMGNRIIFNSSVLINMSMQTKTQLLNSTREIGLFTRNEQREMFGYPPIEGGDDTLISLNYIKGSDQSAYQIGNKEEKENGNQQEPND